MTGQSDNQPRTERERKVAAAAAAAARAKALREKSKKTFVGKQVGGFMEFVREQGVVGLAVGLAIGTAATVLVKSIVDNLINPLVGAIMPGSSELGSKFYCLEKVGEECVNKLGWGAVVSNLISFLSVAAVIYFVVKGLRLDRLDKKKNV